MQHCQRARGRHPENSSSVKSSSLRLGGAVKVAIGALNQCGPRVGSFLCVPGESVENRDVSGTVHSKDSSAGAGAPGPRRSVEVAIASLGQPRPGGSAFCVIVELVQSSKTPGAINLVNRPTVNPPALQRRSVEVSIACLDQPSRRLSVVIERM